MNEDAEEQTVEQPVEPVELPPQESAEDTTNWENRPVTAPNGRLIIETYQGDDDGTTVAE